MTPLTTWMGPGIQLKSWNINYLYLLFYWFNLCCYVCTLVTEQNLCPYFSDVAWLSRTIICHIIWETSLNCVINSDNFDLLCKWWPAVHHNPYAALRSITPTLIHGMDMLHSVLGCSNPITLYPTVWWETQGWFILPCSRYAVPSEVLHLSWNVPCACACSWDDSENSTSIVSADNIRWLFSSLASYVAYPCHSEQ